MRHESLWGRPEIIAAFIGVAGIIVGILISVGVDVWREARRETAARRRFAASLLAESTALRERYLEIVVEPLEKWKENERLQIGGSIQVTNLFAVYDGNTDKLGLFRTTEAEAMVRAYTLAKSHAESLNLMAQTIGNLLGQVMTFQAIGNHGAVTATQISITGITNEAVPRLKKESANVQKAAEEAIAILKRYVRHG